MSGTLEQHHLRVSPRVSRHLQRVAAGGDSISAHIRQMIRAHVETESPDGGALAANLHGLRMSYPRRTDHHHMLTTRQLVAAAEKIRERDTDDGGAAVSYSLCLDPGDSAILDALTGRWESRSAALERILLGETR